MASVGVNPQFGFGGFTKKNPFEISNNNNPTTGFGVPTPFSGQSTSNSSSFTASAPLFGTTSQSPFSSGGQTSNSATTSSFGTGPVAAFRPSSTGLSSYSSSTTLRFGTAPFSFQQTTNPLTTSMISTPTTSPSISNVSVSGPPFSGCSIQGTRQEAYKETAFDDPLVSALAFNKSYKILSISAMPCYINKSHEELRLEDYTLTGKAGIASTTTTTTTPNIQPIYPQPVITPFSPPTFVPPTSNTYITPNFRPIAPQPVITPFPKFDNPFSTPSPNSTTGVLQDSTVPVTSIPPETVSESKSGSVTENNNQQQQHEYTLPIIKPFQYGISCLPVKYENPKPAQQMPLVNVRHLSMGRRRLPIKKYKPNADEKRVPFFEELPAGIYKKGAGLIPRENPRSWVVLSSPSSFRMIP